MEVLPNNRLEEVILSSQIGAQMLDQVCQLAENPQIEDKEI